MNHITTMNERRQILLELIRTRHIQTKEQLLDILDEEFDHAVTENTITRDMKALNVGFHRKDRTYYIQDDHIDRIDIYDELKQILRHLTHKYEMTGNRQGIIFHTDFGTSQRLAGMLEALRYDEETSGQKRSFRDYIQAVMDGGITDTVLVMFFRVEDAQRFYKKLDVLKGVSKEWDWARNKDEADLMRSLVWIEGEDK